jgi:hypothetical protein
MMRRLSVGKSQSVHRNLCGGVDNTFSALELCGQCECGKVGYTARGPSAINFFSHSSAPRNASGEPFLIASGFKPNQVMWRGNVMNSVTSPEYMPPNSSNPHYFCPCDKKQYLGVDATRLLGIIALNLRRADGFANNTLPDAYRPNHHVFYADRVVDCPDRLPKWKTVLEGDLLPELSVDQSLSVANLMDMSLAQPAASSTITQRNRPMEWMRADKMGRGRIRKDVLPMSPVRPAEPSVYHFCESEFPANNHTLISEKKIRERVERKYDKSSGAYVPPSKNTRGAIIIGGGHNGLVSAAYLAKSGVDVLVLERRYIVGGAAVTEEMVPGFKFSRASYLAGLLRPQIIADLELEKFGFKYLPRNPSSFTPTLMDSPYAGKYLILGEDEEENYKSIAQFSVKDAEAYPHYEEFLGEWM